jgi:predicted ABC-type ATPase
VPNLFVIAGPNGAGKSTSAPELLSGVRRVAEFVNADVIQKEEGVSEIQAGRRTLERLSALADAGLDMAFETTLASTLLLARIRRMQASGYAFHLYFFWLPSADMAVRRVAARVASGGHHIPEDVIRRRYDRGLDNFFNHYFSAADAWTFFDNTAGSARGIAWRDVGDSVRVGDNRLWNQLMTRHMKPRAEEEQAVSPPEKLWTSEDLLDAVNLAVRAALKRHKERGESVVQWRDGRIVELKPEEIDV